MVETVRSNASYYKCSETCLSGITVQNGSKNAPNVYNSKLGIFRPSPWTKIPALRYVLLSLQRDKKNFPARRQYDYLFYIDSDAVVTPSMHWKSVGTFFDYWGDHKLYPPGFINRENNQYEKHAGIHINNASFVFLSNQPFDHYPCTGVFFLNTVDSLTADLLMDWWDTTDLPNYLLYEQDNLHDMIVQNERINSHIAYMDSEPQLLPCGNNWICHYTHFYLKDNERDIRAMIRNDRHINESTFSSLLKNISDFHVISIPSLTLTQYVEGNIDFEDRAESYWDRHRNKS